MEISLQVSPIKQARPRPRPRLSASLAASMVRHKTPSPQKQDIFLFEAVSISPKKRGRDASQSVDESPTKKHASGPAKAHGFEISDEQQALVLLQTTKHLEFDFSMVTEDGSLRSWCDEKLIEATFPGIAAFTVADPFVVASFVHLPAKPWPISFAGAPLLLRQVPEPTPERPFSGLFEFKFGESGRAAAITTTAAFKRGEQPTNELLSQIVDALQPFQVSVASLTFILPCLFIVEVTSPKAFKAAQLPHGGPGYALVYKGAPLISSQETAGRNIQPSGEISDDSNYASGLRPGVMLSDGDPERELGTTAGVSVVDAQGNVFVTVAAHGFGDIGSAVFHPNRAGVKIGTIARRIGTTDVALMALEPGVAFYNETFESPGGPAIVLSEFQSYGEILRFDLVEMDTPYSGHCDGKLLGCMYERLHEDSNKDWYVSHDWLYTGNGRTEMRGGTCGTVIVNTHNHKVVGFYRFVEESTGLSILVSAERLIREGYRIAPSSLSL